MSPDRLEGLRERLLRGGVAARHVGRYLRELQEHAQDLERAQLEKGIPPGSARQAAWAHLGSEDSLVQGMLERPELRSWAARFPTLLFGVAPALAWLGAPIAALVLLSTLPEQGRQMQVDAALIEAYRTLCSLYTRVVPVLLGALLLHLAARQRLRRLWPLLGTAAVDVLAGTLTVYSFPGQLGINSSLLPWLLPFSNAVGPRDALALAQGLLTGGGLLACSVLIEQLLRRWGWSGEQSLAPLE